MGFFPGKAVQQQAGLQQLILQQQQAMQQALGQQQYGLPVVSTIELQATTSISIQRDEVNNCYRCKVHVIQGCSPQQKKEIFVLYDGPFPITNEGIMEHLANFARERLVDEK